MIARVDKKGNIIGKIEKWDAHRKGLLHKGFSIGLIYQDHYIIQHRKHPAFDGIFDITSSSHQLFSNGKLQNIIEASLAALEREWNLTEEDLLSKPKKIGHVYYKVKDPKSTYTEHEVCDMLIAHIHKLPTPNYNFAYGFSLIKREQLLNNNSRIYENLSKWTKVAIEKNLL